MTKPPATRQSQAGARLMLETGIMAARLARFLETSLPDKTTGGALSENKAFLWALFESVSPKRTLDSWLRQSRARSTGSEVQPLDRLLQTLALTPQEFDVLMLAALSFTLLTAQADEEAATQRLTELLNQAQTISARFSQLTLDASGTQLQETAGQLVLKRPGLFRWHTDEPMEQLLVSNGQKVWLYDPDLEQVTIQTLDQRLTHTPALLLSGDVSQIRENFEISGGGFLATGKDDEAVHKIAEWVRMRIAFYGSTPAYWPVLELHGLGDLGHKLNTLSKEGKWDEMTKSIPDDFLHLCAAIGRHDEIAPIIERRFGNASDALNASVNQATPSDMPPDLVQDIQRIPVKFKGYKTAW